jgi:hypothetical protein
MFFVQQSRQGGKLDRQGIDLSNCVVYSWMRSRRSTIVKGCIGCESIILLTSAGGGMGGVVIAGF